MDKHQKIAYVMGVLEGAYDNDSNDSGGETFWGVTAVGWEDYCGEKELPEDGLSLEQAELVYLDVWDKMHCDELPKELDLVVFAFGLNAGYPRANKYMQRTLGLTADGIIGRMTLGGYAMLREMNIEQLQEAQYDFVELAVQHYFSIPSFVHFGRGWINRLLKTVVKSWD